MIVKGIVTKQELQRIRKALPAHGLEESPTGGFGTWQTRSDINDPKSEKVIWVEVNVGKGLFDYLSNNGFFNNPTIPRIVMEES